MAMTNTFYNQDQKEQFLSNSSNAKRLITIFGNSYNYECRKDRDLYHWTTDEYICFLAENRIITAIQFNIYKSSIREYLKYFDINTDKIDRIKLNDVHDYVVDNNISVFFMSMGELVRNIQLAITQYFRDDEDVYRTNTITTCAVLLYCGLTFDEATSIDRLSVANYGVSKCALPTKITNKMVASIINEYARKNINWVDDLRTDSVLLRNMKNGEEPLTISAFKRHLVDINRYSPYDITLSNIRLSGEFYRLYQKDISKGEDTKICYDDFNKISKAEFIKYNIKSIETQYILYCRLMKTLQM